MAVDIIARGLADRALQEIGDISTSELVSYKNTVTIVENLSTVPIGIAEFDKDNDFLMVFVNSTFAALTSDYTIPNNDNISKVAGEWNSGTVFNFVIIKKDCVVEEVASIISEHTDNSVPHFRYNFTEVVSNNPNGTLNTVTHSIGGVRRKLETFSYNGDGDISNINVKQYAENGTTVIFEYNDATAYVGDEMTITRTIVV
jgi:hypothetical protein